MQMLREFLCRVVAGARRIVTGPGKFVKLNGTADGLLEFLAEVRAGFGPGGAACPGSVDKGDDDGSQRKVPG